MIELISIIAGLMGVSARELWQIYKSHEIRERKKWNNERRNAYLTHLRNIASQGLHIDLLDAFYEDNALSTIHLQKYNIDIEGRRIPFAFVGKRSELTAIVPIPVPSHSALHFGNHSLIGSQIPIISMNMNDLSRELAELVARGIKIYDRPVYALESFNFNQNSWNAEFRLDSYINWRLKFGILQEELFQALIDTNYSINTVLQNRNLYLTQRDNLLPSSGNMFASPSCRLAAGGPAILCAFYRKEFNDYAIPIKRRSHKMGSGPGMLGVIPQGFHQHSSSASEELSFILTMFRELFEELFGGTDAEVNTTRVVGDWFLSPEHPPLQWFTNSKDYRIYITGFGSDLTSGSFDISMLLVIDDPDYWNQFRTYMKLNWEFAGLSDHAPSPFVSSSDSNELRRLILLREWAQSALFSFVRGLLVLNDTSPYGRVSLPEIEECDA